MKKLLPSGVELAVLATMAVLFAVVFSSLQQETALVLFMFPLLLTSMLMGARRNGKLGSPVVQPVPAPAQATVEPDQAA